MTNVNSIDEGLREGVRRLAEDMQATGYRRHDPVREIFGLVGDKWSTLILLVLDIGCWRHAELRRVLGQLGEEDGISQRMLTLKLRALEREGLVDRMATADVPPKVSYRLTPLGHGLTEEARRLIGWVQSHRAQIEQARLAFDLRESD